MRRDRGQGQSPENTTVKGWPEEDRTNQETEKEREARREAGQV